MNPDYVKFNRLADRGFVDLVAYMEIPLAWLGIAIPQNMKRAKKYTIDPETQQRIESSKTVEDFFLFIRESNTQDTALVGLLPDGDDGSGFPEDVITEAEFDTLVGFITQAGLNINDLMSEEEMRIILNNPPDTRAVLYSRNYRVFADDPNPPSTTASIAAASGGGGGGKK